MKKLHLLLLCACAMLLCASCNENEIISEQVEETYSRSQEIQNILGNIENVSFYTAPELEDTPLTDEEIDRIKGIALKAKSSLAAEATTRQVARSFCYGYHEELVPIDNYQIIAGMEWEGEYSSSYSAPNDISFAEVHISLKNAPEGYAFLHALRGWDYWNSTLTFRGNGEIRKYINNQEVYELIGYTFTIEPRCNGAYSGYGENFRYIIDRDQPYN